MTLRILLFALVVATMAAFGLFTQASAHPHGAPHWGSHGGHWGHGWHGGGYGGPGIYGGWGDDDYDCGWRWAGHHRRVWVCD